MPPQPYRPRSLQWQVFRGSDAIRRGLLTVDQLRSSAWVRLRRDVYADARLDQDHQLACQAAALRLPSDAAIAGPSAAYLYGVEHAATFTDSVHVILPPEKRRHVLEQTRQHRALVVPEDLRTSNGIRRTAPLRTAWDLASWLELPRAVSMLDTMLQLGHIAPSELAAYVASRSGQRGWRRAARAFDLADGRAESPPESRLRVRLVLAGLPRPNPQHPVRLPNGAVYRPDLPWPEYQVAVEYDGKWHSTAEQLRIDRRRLNQLVSAGWIILHATSEHLGEAFPHLVRQVRAALRSRGWPG